jgi:hypothetical protein
MHTEIVLPLFAVAFEQVLQLIPQGPKKGRPSEYLLNIECRKHTLRTIVRLTVKSEGQSAAANMGYLTLCMLQMRASNTSLNIAIHLKAKRDCGLDTNTALQSPYSPRSPSCPMAKFTWKRAKFEVQLGTQHITHLEQRIKRLDSDNIRVQIHTTNIAHQAQPQHVSAVRDFTHYEPIAVDVLRQRHLVVGNENKCPKNKKKLNRPETSAGAEAAAFPAKAANSLRI